jgi:predicted ATPase
MPGQPVVTRIMLSNYRSIRACDVQLGMLTFLVGPNGSGKSNFLDSLRFVSESLRSSLDHALRDRGGINEVRRRSKGHPTQLGMRLELSLRDGSVGSFAFKLGARSRGGYEVLEEQCELRSLESPGFCERFRVERGEVVESTLKASPPAAIDRLYLVNAASASGFRSVYDSLSSMGFYNLNPDRIRDLQTPDPGDLLLRDGSNLASVLERLRREDRPAFDQICELVGKVVPGVVSVHTKQLGPKETLEFRQNVAGDSAPWRFSAANMSDGTLRALGVLVALFQSPKDAPNRIPLVGIEEPELALHPSAAGALLTGLLLARDRTQVLVTSHSPDLLDDRRVPTEAILAVSAEGGVSNIAPVDEASRSVLREELYTAGELLRLNQLQPEPSALPAGSRLNLIGGVAS